MENHRIDVDDAVWEMLKKNVKASGESPNDVLKRLLNKDVKEEAHKKPDSQPAKDWTCF